MTARLIIILSTALLVAIGNLAAVETVNSAAQISEFP